MALKIPSSSGNLIRLIQKHYQKKLLYDCTIALQLGRYNFVHCQLGKLKIKSFQIFHVFFKIYRIYLTKCIPLGVMCSGLRG